MVNLNITRLSNGEYYFELFTEDYGVILAELGGEYYSVREIKSDNKTVVYMVFIPKVGYIYANEIKEVL